MNIRVRFAPSPTGFLHVGNARIAIMNYLFTKKNHGKFILRIDDTDVERSTQEYENIIFENLRWLGIEYDELYKQSNHLDKYREAFEHLKKIGRIYPCYESKEELSLKRKSQSMQGIPPVYDRSSLKLKENEQKSFEEKKGIKPYWRFKLSDHIISWIDMVHGEISIPLNTVSDPVITKPDGSFTYTFASVVDDVNTKITHIIRGDDHITNTASQIDIFMAICDQCPKFAHIPLLSSVDGQEVSKRTGSPLSIVNMKKDGILPKSIWNILATLGTSSNADHNDSLDTLVNKFDFCNISLSSPKFNIMDLKLMSRKIISESNIEDVKEELSKIGLQDISTDFWDTIKGNINSICDATKWFEILYKNKTNNNKIDKIFAEQMLETLQNPVDFDIWIAELKKKSGKKGKDLFHTIRIAITGLDSGPELKKIINIIGYNSVKHRIERSLI